MGSFYNQAGESRLTGGDTHSLSTKLADKWSNGRTIKPRRAQWLQMSATNSTHSGIVTALCIIDGFGSTRSTATKRTHYSIVGYQSHIFLALILQQGPGIKSLPLLLRMCGTTAAPTLLYQPIASTSTDISYNYDSWIAGTSKVLEFDHQDYERMASNRNRPCGSECSISSTCPGAEGGMWRQCRT